jgi:hypothetical protein
VEKWERRTGLAARAKRERERERENGQKYSLNMV